MKLRIFVPVFSGWVDLGYLMVLFASQVTSNHIIWKNDPTWLGPLLLSHLLTWKTSSNKLKALEDGWIAQVEVTVWIYILHEFWKTQQNFKVVIEQRRTHSFATNQRLYWPKRSLMNRLGSWLSKVKVLFWFEGPLSTPSCWRIWMQFVPEL